MSKCRMQPRERHFLAFRLEIGNRFSHIFPGEQCFHRIIVISLSTLGRHLARGGQDRGAITRLVKVIRCTDRTVDVGIINDAH